MILFRNGVREVIMVYWGIGIVGIVFREIMIKVKECIMLKNMINESIMRIMKRIMYFESFKINFCREYIWWVFWKWWGVRFEDCWNLLKNE